MPYVSSRVVHDADSHLMETPDWLIGYADPSMRERIAPLTLGGQGIAEMAVAIVAHQQANPVDPARFVGHEHALFVDKNWACYGSCDPIERRTVLDHLGFASQLVFSTYSHRVLLLHPDTEPQVSHDPDVHFATVRAHNRGMTEFCSVDPRLLPVGWVSLHDPERAVAELEFALEAGCAAIEVPSWPTGPTSPTHVALDPFYARVQEAGVPLVVHIGGGGRLVADAYEHNGRTYENRFYDGEPSQRALIFLGMPRPIEMFIGALVFDRVFERFPGLRLGVIENGATWFPTLMDRLDLALRAFGRKEEWQGMSMLPSEYLQRQVKVAPFAYESLDLLVERSSSDLYLFNSDFPHDEGSLDPVAEFEASATTLSDDDLDRFYRRNFEELMGPALLRRLGTPVGEPSA